MPAPDFFCTRGGAVHFCGDFHLPPGENLEFLCRWAEKTVRAGEHLVLLGDFFEAWFENWFSPAPGYEAAYSFLRQVRDRGASTHLVTGNRDFLAGRVLRRRSGLELHPHGLVLDSGRSLLLALHGDELLPEDASYRRYRRLVRHPLALLALRTLPVVVLKRLAVDTRRKSAAKVAALASTPLNPKLDEVLPLMDMLGAKQAITGHLHGDFLLEGRGADGSPRRVTVLPESGVERVSWRTWDGAELLALKTAP